MRNDYWHVLLHNTKSTGSVYIKPVFDIKDKP